MRLICRLCWVVSLVACGGEPSGSPSSSAASTPTGATSAAAAVSSGASSASVAPGAAFRAAIIAFIDGSARTAAAEFDALAERYPTSAEANAARYRAGRAWHAAGDTAAARARSSPRATWPAGGSRLTLCTSVRSMSGRAHGSAGAAS